MAKRFTPAVYEEKVKPQLVEWFSTRTKAELEELAGDVVPLSAIKTIDEVVNDPHIAARDMIVDVEYPDLGVLRMFGQPIKLGVTPAQPRGLAPRVGEHTDVLLRALAGLDDEAIAALRAEEVV